MRVTIVRRAAFEYIANENFLSFKLDCFKYFIEQLSGASDEWFTLFIFISTWRFADNDYICFRISYAEYKFDSCLSKVAFYAGIDCVI